MLNFLTSHLKVALMHLRQPLGQGVVRGMKMVPPSTILVPFGLPQAHISSFYTIPFLLDHVLS